MAEQARKFRDLRRSAKSKVGHLLLVGVAVTIVLLVAEVLSRALLGQGVARYLLQPVLGRSHPPDPERSMPLWAVVALPFLRLVGKAARDAIDACSRRRLFWAAAAARRQANAARLAAKRSGAQQPSTQP